MSLLYVEEHCTCFNYNSGKGALIKPKNLAKGEVWETVPSNNLFVCVLEGEMQFSLGKFTNRKISKGNIVLLVANSPFKGIAEKNTRLLIFKMRSETHICDRYSLEMLMKETNSKEPDLSFLEMNKVLNEYVRSLDKYILDGLRCFFFHEIKIKELFYILRGYYPKEELFAFFYPILSNDISFSDFIQKNYHKVKTVKELADLANYSLSGFVKRFKKVFGISAYQWINEQKATLIYREINEMTKTLKEISFEYGFSSPAHFNDFCKNHFGDTPGNIRKTKLNKNSESDNKLAEKISD